MGNNYIVYPQISRRMNEEGIVVLRVLIGADGRAKRVEIKKSSGFARLDQAAREGLLKTRYKPSTVGGVPVDDWYDIPVNFKLSR